MMGQEKRFIRISAQDVEVGRPLRWSLYDGNRQVLIPKGDALATQAEIESLFQVPVFRMLQENDPKSARPHAPDVPLAEPAPRPVAAPEMTLDSSKIRIGNYLQLQSAPDQPRFVVRLIGYQRGQGVIVTPPEHHGELAILREGQTFVARFFSGQSAYAFSTTVVKQTSVPFPHLYLSYPKTVDGVEVRRSARVDVDVIASVDAGRGAPPISGKICNLSIGGAGLRTRVAMPEQSENVLVKFKVTVLGIDSFLVCEAEVCSETVMTDESGLPFLYGLRFLTLDNATQLSLAAFVYSSLQEEKV